MLRMMSIGGRLGICPLLLCNSDFSLHNVVVFVVFAYFCKDLYDKTYK